MSRPGSPAGTSGRGVPPPASAPLRVVAERLSADEARADGAWGSGRWPAQPGTGGWDAPPRPDTQPRTGGWAAHPDAGGWGADPDTGGWGAADRADTAPETTVLAAVGTAVGTAATALSTAVAPALPGHPSSGLPSAPPGTVAPSGAGALATVDAPGLPVPTSHRSGLVELLALITGRGQAGRHRPDTVHRHAWSMFAPQRRPGRTRRRWLRA